MKPIPSRTTYLPTLISYYPSKGKPIIRWENRVDTTLSLGCLSSNPGNYKTPTPFSWNKQVSQYPRGIEQTVSFNVDGSERGGQTFALTTGILNCDYATAVIDSSVIDRQYNKALEKFYDKVRENSTNLAVDVVEWRQTAQMLVNSVRAIRRPLALVEKSLLAHRKKTGAPLSNAWLQYTYGWSPLCSTISALMRQTARTCGDPIKVKVRASTRDDTTVFGRSRVPSWASTSRRDMSTYGVSIIGLYVVNDADKARLSDLSSLDPLTITWELVPFSFVVDWFYDVGSYLHLAEAALGRGLQFLGGQRTDFVSVEQFLNVYGTLVAGTGWISHSNINAESYALRRNMNRSTLLSFPRPTYPSFNVDLGWRRLLTSAALLNSLR